jgi:hypothetical protein
LNSCVYYFVKLFKIRQALAVGLFGGAATEVPINEIRIKRVAKK